MKSQQLTAVHAFFSRTIEPLEFARYVRELQAYAVQKALESEDGHMIKDGHYFLNEFLEVLDPKCHLKT